eukprot:2977746-Prymnesium_polylepis.1
MLPRDFPSQGAAVRALKRGRILIDAELARKGSTAIVGCTVQYIHTPPRAHLAGARATAPTLQLELPFHDDWLAVVLKPAGVS